MVNSLSLELAMMGYEPDCQQKLFYNNINLEKRIPQKHILRRISETIDFNFIYNEVKSQYGYNGNESVPPPTILKMMLILFLYNVRSERELMETIPLRLDWLWFLGYDIDSEIPDHSVLSKARSRWGVEAFKTFFERIVWQCVQAGLVSGDKLFVDASLVNADASNNSVVNTQSLRRYLNERYRLLEESLDDLKAHKTTPANSRHISTTDPDASVVRHSGGRSKLRYKTHRGVDPKYEVITATKMTPGSVDEGQLLGEMIELHEDNTQTSPDAVVADSRYGKTENYLLCHDLGKEAHIPSLEKTQRGTGRQKGILPKEAFTYHPETDTFTCPAGQRLKRRHHHKKRNHYEYIASPGTCARCELRDRCTRAKDARTLKRHVRQEDLDTMRKCATSSRAKRDIKHRQHLSERSFAQSCTFGYKRARWRRLWRASIQDFLVASIQNILILLRHVRDHAQSKAAAQREPQCKAPTLSSLLLWLPSACKAVKAKLSQAVRYLALVFAGSNCELATT